MTQVFTRETLKIQSVEPNVYLDVWLYKPQRQGPFPVVVAGHGLTLGKDCGLASFAETWAADASYASLVLDYRHFGDSDGQPRNLTVLSKQLEDFQSVITWARAHPETFRVDKIVVMGSATSGLFVADLLAQDHQLAGGMAHSPLLDGYATLTSGSPNIPFLFWAAIDTVKGKLGLSPTFVRAVGRPGDLAFMTSPSSYPGFETMWAQGRTTFAQAPNVLAPRLLFELMAYRPGLRLKEAKIPMLVVMPEHDDMIPAAITREVVAKADGKVKFVVAPGGHYDIMKGGEGFDTNIKAQIEYLRGLLV